MSMYAMSKIILSQYQQLLLIEKQQTISDLFILILFKVRYMNKFSFGMVTVKGRFLWHPFSNKVLIFSNKVVII